MSVEATIPRQKDAPLRCSLITLLLVLPIPLMNPISSRRLGLPRCYGWHRLLADQWITVANTGAAKGANRGAKIMSLICTIASCSLPSNIDDAGRYTLLASILSAAVISTGYSSRLREICSDRGALKSTHLVYHARQAERIRPSGPSAG